VLGAGGQLGRALVASLGDAAAPFTRTQCDLLVEASVRNAVASHPFEWVINAAAFTDVDGAEAKREQCMIINHVAVKWIAESCQRQGSKLIQISSDYVFGGDLSRQTPYREDDAPNPQSVYANSKFLGEQVARCCDHHLILRTCGLYSPQNAEQSIKNFCNTIINAAQKRSQLSIVNDQWCTPTYVPHLVDAIEALMKQDAAGTFHVVNEGHTNWYEFGRQLLALAGIPTPVIPICSADYPAVATRPSYSVLDTSKFVAATGNPLPTWEEALAHYVSEQPLALANHSR
jgi:dTDP-4-dehydrorhamnose reductase